MSDFIDHDGDDKTLRSLNEGFPGHGFSVIQTDSEERHHQESRENLETELMFLNLMDYSENAKDCLQLVIDEAKERQQAAVTGEEVAF